jgi:hypothetical protein
MQNKVSYCTTELRFCRKEGGVLWIEAFARPIESRNGEPAGASGMLLIDITASREAEQKLQSAKETAEAANRSGTGRDGGVGLVLRVTAKARGAEPKHLSSGTPMHPPCPAGPVGEASAGRHASKSKNRREYALRRQREFV